MMRRLAPLLLLALSAAAAAQTTPENADVLAAAQTFADAQVHGDRATLERILAPDYLVVRGSGEVGGRKDVIDGFTDARSHLEPYQVTDRLLLRPAPDTAIVGGEAWVRGTDEGRPFTRHFRYSDTFVRRANQWLAVFTQITPLPSR